MFIGTCLLSAGISHAQELSPIAANVLIQAATRAKLCTYKIRVVKLDVDGQERGEWSDPEKTRDVLKKILDGEEGYRRPLDYFVGTASFDAESGSPIVIDAELAKEIPYSRWKFTYFRLQELKFYLEQRMYGDQWLPYTFELVTKYWLGALSIGPTIHEKYRAEFDCSAAQVAAK